MENNDRLSAALKVAKSRKVKRRKYAFQDPKIQAKAKAIRLAKYKAVKPTGNMRIELDAIKLCKSTFNNSHDRIVETSKWMREGCRKRLGL